MATGAAVEAAMIPEAVVTAYLAAAAAAAAMAAVVGSRPMAATAVRRALRGQFLAAAAVR
jgi:hypothetical protein